MLPRLRYSCREEEGPFARIVPGGGGGPFARLFLEGGEVLSRGLFLAEEWRSFREVVPGGRGGFWRGIGLSGTCCRGLKVEGRASFWGIFSGTRFSRYIRFGKLPQPMDSTSNSEKPSIRCSLKRQKFPRNTSDIQNASG